MDFELQYKVLAILFFCFESDTLDADRVEWTDPGYFHQN